MKKTLIASLVAAAFVFNTLPAAAFTPHFPSPFGPHFFFKKKGFFWAHKKIYVPKPKATPRGSGGGSTPWPVFCVFGSALGLIGMSAHIGRTQSRELTVEEAQTIGFTCGIGTFKVLADNRSPR